VGTCDSILDVRCVMLNLVTRGKTVIAYFAQKQVMTSPENRSQVLRLNYTRSSMGEMMWDNEARRGAREERI